MAAVTPITPKNGAYGGESILYSPFADMILFDSDTFLQNYIKIPGKIRCRSHCVVSLYKMASDVVVI